MSIYIVRQHNYQLIEIYLVSRNVVMRLYSIRERERERERERQRQRERKGEREREGEDRQAHVCINHT